WQKVISEPALRRCGQHEEHHDRAVHGEQTEISFGLYLANQRNRSRRPDHVDAHQQRQEHPHKHCRQRQEVVLDPDHLVIKAEHIFTNETLRRAVRVSFLGHHYCFSASRCANHLSNSSWLTTFTMPCIL